MKKLFLLLILFSLMIIPLSACSGKASGPTYASVPAGKAYAEGKEVYFSHTEVSDAEVAEKLTKMMNSPVLLVPSLAEAPESMTATVYVFENGVRGKGPFNFQVDVFDNPPGSEGYTPLRRIILVKWVDESKAYELKSADEILSLEAAGILILTKSDIVVNMPFMVWDGGKR